MSERQDKELGHTPANSLSAHLFLWATGLLGWATFLGYAVDYMRERPGTRPLPSLQVPNFEL